MPTYNLNGNVVADGTNTILYRVGTSDRTIGASAAGYPTGFVVLNQTNGNAFIVSGGVWASTTFPATLLALWGNTVSGTGGPGVGYRIGTSDRTVGKSTGAPNGFKVLNTTNGNVFTVSGGVWAASGTFSTALINAWLENSGVTFNAADKGNQPSGGAVDAGNQ